MAKGFNSIEEALEDLKKGKCIVVADNEDRENEGDLVLCCRVCYAGGD